jgi:hypothetical protein
MVVDPIQFVKTLQQMVQFCDILHSVRLDENRGSWLLFATVAN